MTAKPYYILTCSHLNANPYIIAGNLRKQAFVMPNFFPWFVTGPQETRYVLMTVLNVGRYQINFQ